MRKLYFLKIFLLINIIILFSYVNVKKKSINIKGKIMEKIRKSIKERNNKKETDKKETDEIEKNTLDEEETQTEKIFNNYKEGYENFDNQNSQGTTPDGDGIQNKISKENVKGFWDESKKGKVRCSIKFRKIFEFIYMICSYILLAFSFVWNLIKEPVKSLFKSALGDYYTILTAPFMAIFKIYKLAIKGLLFIIKLPFLLIRLLYRIIGSIIIRVLKVFPGRWFLDILAYIITIPYLFIVPIQMALSPITNAFGVFCWSDRGLINEIEDNVNWTIDNMELIFEKATNNLKYSAGMN